MNLEINEFISFVSGLLIFASGLYLAVFFLQGSWGRRFFMLFAKIFAKIGRCRAIRTIDDLIAGKLYKVGKTFIDCHGIRVKAGDNLTFLGHDYLPFDGRHHLRFAENTIRLQKEAHQEILQNIDVYLKTV